MKRKEKQSRNQRKAKLCEVVLAQIQDGITTRTELKLSIEKELRSYTIDDLFDRFTSIELSKITQSLRAAGAIEITKGNEPVPVDQLSSDDIEFIDARRAVHIAGELKTRVLFNHRHGRLKQQQEAADQLAIFDAVTIESAETETAELVAVDE